MKTAHFLNHIKRDFPLYNITGTFLRKFEVFFEARVQGFKSRATLNIDNL